ncbi:MAG: cupin domain-containing protein [Oscillospiraceae bacterium]|nr:cupin domain-containing protein [Oscillospiraceae bacterium]
MQNSRNNKDRNGIFPKGMKAPDEFFTGTVWSNVLVPDKDNMYNCQVYDVVFEPSSRTNWHKHPGGQILLVTDGEGFYQEKGKTAQLLQKGDSVNIPPDVEHWHGAAPDSRFTHIGISPNTQKGDTVWFGTVTDDQYREAVLWRGHDNGKSLIL